MATSKRSVANACRCFLIVLVMGSSRLAVPTGLAGTTAASAPVPPTIVERFLARDEPPIVSYRAQRRMEARNVRFNKHAWMDVVTSADSAHGFAYRIVAEGGSEYIRDKVLRKTLEREAEAWKTGEAARAVLSELNYRFEDVTAVEGLMRVQIAPRRKDQFLVRGAIYLTPEEADLVRIEGEPAKRPSFWTRNVHVIRRYGRIEGFRVPLGVDARSDVFMAGRSTFSMTYAYEELNGKTIGPPVPYDPGTLGAPGINESLPLRLHP